MATSDDLSPQARRIVDAARDADQPSDVDRRRVRGAVMAAVAAAAAGTAGKTAAAASAAPASAGTAAAATAVPFGVKAMAVAAALAAVGVGAYVVGGAGEPAAERDHRPALDVDADDAGQPAVEIPREPRRAPEPEPEPEMEFAPDHVSAPEQRPPSTIQAERELLARARAAHTGGNAGEALALLDDYTRQFAGGKLLEERSALRVLVLCDLGRTPQAAREARSFLRRWPQSVQAERVHRSCAGDANE